MKENDIGTIIVDTAFQIHRNLGPGLLESVYELVLAKELEAQGLSVARQVAVPVIFKGIRFEQGFRADLLVEDKVIVELKSVETLNNSHKKQLLTYLRLTGKKLGYLINFGEAYFKNAIVRTINGIL
ncbi:MAG: GxxExxY protein [Verrucomicrobia bacterium]|nr:GxxExxY protein [Verrucomicrobiota bacterium]